MGNWKPYRGLVLVGPTAENSRNFSQCDSILIGDTAGANTYPYIQCISFWPEDGWPYVALGKLLSKQSKFAEARVVYERGCQATQGENPCIWQCWAVLENKNGNIRRARELFDAATVADKKHVAAWHGWAVLELKQGNIKKARNLLGKGIKYCGGNEYIYQTLALLEAKGNRIEQVLKRSLQETGFL